MSAQVMGLPYLIDAQNLILSLLCEDTMVKDAFCPFKDFLSR